MLLSIAAFVVVVGVLIFVHELGHFAVAKAVGVQVLRFSLGFGKALVSWRRGETEYVIAALPLGGYVKMASVEEEGVQGQLEGGAAEAPVDPARAFERRPLPHRFAVILAGVTMNVVFAWAVYTGLAATYGTSALATTQVDTVLAGQLPAGAEALSALRRGDRIVTVNGDSVGTWDVLIRRIALADFPLRVGVAGRAAPIVVAPRDRSGTTRAAIVNSLVVAFPAVVGMVAPGSAADRAGLRSGDTVIAAGPYAVSSWPQFARIVRGSAHTALPLVVARGGTRDTLRIVPELVHKEDPETGVVGDYGQAGVTPEPPLSHRRLAPLAAVGEGWRQTVSGLGSVVASVKLLVTGQSSLRDLGGPIAIGRMSGEVARQGAPSFLVFMAFLSLNLAVLNLLPIPVLDGGQVMFLVAETVRRRPLSLELRLRLTQVGFAVILVLMVFILGNDVLNLFIR